MLRRHLGPGSICAATVLAVVASLGAFCATPPSATATGTGQAVVWITTHGVQAELEGTLSFDLCGLTLTGSGHGTGELDFRGLAGWAWGVVWGTSPCESDSEPATLVGGLAVEGSPALGSGSVEGVCYLALRQRGIRTNYCGTFVTQASSHPVPSPRPGTLALEGEVRLMFTLVPCLPGEGFPWDSARWPSELLAEFLERLGP